MVAGKLGDVTPPAPPPDSWASRADSDVAIWTIKMAPGARWTVPPAAAGSNRALYFFQGRGLRVAGREIPPSHEIEVRADRALRARGRRRPRPSCCCCRAARSASRSCSTARS